MRSQMSRASARELSPKTLRSVAAITLTKDGIIRAPSGPLNGREPFVLDGQMAGVDLRVIMTAGNLLIGTCVAVDESVSDQVIAERVVGAYAEARKSSKAEGYFYLARPGKTRWIAMIGNGVANLAALCGLSDMDDMAVQSDGKALYIGGSDGELGYPMIAEVNSETGRPKRRWTIVPNKTATLEWSAASPLGILAIVKSDGKLQTMFKSNKSEDFSPVNNGVACAKVFTTLDGDFYTLGEGNGKVYAFNPATTTAREIVQIRSDEDIAGIAHERDRAAYLVVQQKNGSGWRTIAL